MDAREAGETNIQGGFGPEAALKKKADVFGLMTEETLD